MGGDKEKMLLYRRLCSKLSEIYRRIFAKRLRVLFIGISKSGKSTLIPAIFEKRYEDPPIQQKSKVKRYTIKGTEFFVYDVPGGRESIGKWDFFYKKCDVLVFVFDSCGSKEDDEAAKTELWSLLYRNMWEKKDMLVLGSKNDKPGAVDCKNIILTLGLAKIYDREVACYSVSAKKLINVDLVIAWLSEQAAHKT